MATATRTIVINDPVGIHARPAAQFVTAATASGQNVTIGKEGAAAVAANSILAVMGLGIKQGDSVVVTVEGDNADAVLDQLVDTLLAAECSTRDRMPLSNMSQHLRT